jgi:glycosyltransferase involved in cell wall biosynthesis
MTRVLCFIGMGWAFGTVHSELSRFLHSRGVICDLLDWSRGYSREEVQMMADCYDYIYSVPGETWPLTDNYGIPHEKIIVVAHGDHDICRPLETRPPDELERFGGYGVISEYLQQVSADAGVSRVPKIVRLGINYRRFLAPVPRELKVVGYGGSMFREDRHGVDGKRGILVKQAVEDAGLVFAPAGQFHFLAMPRYYRDVDAVVVSSTNEGYGLPAMEAAAAGRLVISTPVGGFPDQAAWGAGIAAPLEDDAFKAFVTERLIYYKEHPREYFEMCTQIQAAARHLDWDYVLDEWIELFTRP